MCACVFSNDELKKYLADSDNTVLLSDFVSELDAVSRGCWVGLD